MIIQEQFRVFQDRFEEETSRLSVKEVYYLDLTELINEMVMQAKYVGYIKPIVESVEESMILR